MRGKRTASLVCLTGFILGALVCTQRAGAQSLPLGTVGSVASTSCGPLVTPPPGGTGNYYRDFDPSMTNCFTATLTCPSVNGIGLLADPMQFVYADGKCRDQSHGAVWRQQPHELQHPVVQYEHRRRICPRLFGDL